MDTSSDPIETAWAALGESWDEPEAHKRFVALCMAQGRLADAGRLYREVRDADEGRRAEAERQIDQILVHALSTMELHRSPPAPKRNTMVLLIATAVFVLLVGAVTWAVVGAP